MAELLDKFYADIAGVEVGENDDVSFSGNFAWAFDFFACDFGNDGGIKLKFAIDF